jgi:hypothetical protein
MGDDMTERGHRVQRGKHAAAGGLDVRLHRLDTSLSLRVRLRGLSQRLHGRVAGTPGFHRHVGPVGHRQPCRLLPRQKVLEFNRDLRGAYLERVNLMPIERQLLLTTAEVQLAGVGRFANAGRTAIRLGLLDAQAGEIGFAFGHARRRGRLTFPCLSQTGARDFNHPAQFAIAPREQNLLPSAQFFPQPLVATRLGGLPLQRSPLLFHFEDDVVDASEILLGGLELQFRGAPARLVFRDAGRLFDQLPPIGRSRAQDHADLALLDDRVGLGPEPGVHQELVDVPQPADLPVDQILAFT